MNCALFFLGFLVDENYASRLKEIRSDLLSLYVKKEEGMWLQEIFVNGDHYLGKFLGDCIEIESLSLHEVNIVSFLKKLVPSYENHQLVLLPLNVNSTSAT